MYCPFLTCFCSGEDVARSEAAPGDARSWEATGTSPSWGYIGTGRQSCPWVCRSSWPTRLGRDPRNAHSCDGTRCTAVTVMRRTGYLLSHAIPARLGICFAMPFSLFSPAQKSHFLSVGDNCLANNSSLGLRESIVF